MNNRRPTHSRRQASVDQPRYPPQSQSHLQSPAYLPIQQQLTAAQASDYDSDTPAYLEEQQIPPPPPTRTTDELNLSVLRRYKPEILSILSIAPYAVVYEFSPLPEPTWSKTGIEGSLFICQLEQGEFGEDRYQALVFNRRGLDNFEVELREGDNAGIEITQDYVIISSNAGDEQTISGIFIFSEGPGTSTERTRVLNGELMKQLAVQAGVSRRLAEAKAAQATSVHTNGQMQEAETAADNDHMAQPMGRQISLQQLFGQQRAEDASWSVRVHATESPGPQGFPSFDAGPPARPQPQNQQRDVLADLFRNAGVKANF